MGITSVREKWQGRGATTDEQGVRTLKRQWDVETDSDSTGEPEVIDGVVAHDATAALYAPHPKWPWAVCRKLTADPNNGPRVWTVRAEYSSARFEAKGDGSGGPTGDGSGNSSAPSPQQSNSTPANQRAPTVTVTRKEISKPLEKYRDPITNVETRVLNTVGDPINPTVEVFRSHSIITWKFYRTPAQLNWSSRSGWWDSLNQDRLQVLGKWYEATTLRCVEYGLGTVWETGASGLEFFFELTVQAEHDPDGWQPKVLNTGRRRRTGGSIGDPGNPPRLDVIVDGKGQEVSEPVPLTFDGSPLQPGQDPHYLEPVGYKEYPWKGANGQLTGVGGILE